jgi:hypothetical protein
MAMNVPGEGNVWVHYRGEVSDVSNLPANAWRWDWYYAPQGTSWIYMAPAATGRLGWMDRDRGRAATGPIGSRIVAFLLDGSIWN